MRSFDSSLAAFAPNEASEIEFDLETVFAARNERPSGLMGASMTRGEWSDGAPMRRSQGRDRPGYPCKTTSLLGCGTFPLLQRCELCYRYVSNTSQFGVLIVGSLFWRLRSAIFRHRIVTLQGVTLPPGVQ